MSSPGAAAHAARLIDNAVSSRIFPAAVAEVGNSNGSLWTHASGTLAFDSVVPTTADTIFDLASLTKPIATTTAILQLCASGALPLETPVASVFREWHGAGRDAATIQDLLEHCSGLPVRLLDRPPASRREFEHEICAMPLEYPLRGRAVYSDLDFILLGFLLDDRGIAFDATAWAFPNQRAGAFLGFEIASSDLERAAPTEPLEDDWRRRRLVGEVHDTYAAALGGRAGHAGLFGTASGVGAFAQIVLAAARGSDRFPAPLTPEWVARATTKSAVPGSSRALGWDTMLPTSSCGARMSSDAFGHAGFTGTTLWIAPTRDRYYVLLTNRVCGGGTSDDMQRVRRAFHDALAEF